MASESLRIEEPFAKCVVSGEKVTVTPPGGLLSSRDYVFDKSQQRLTVADKKMVLFGSKKNVSFDDISFGVSQKVGAAYCIEMFCRQPNRPLIVYELTGYADASDRFDPMKEAITSGTGIDRWEGAS